VVVAGSPRGSPRKRFNDWIRHHPLPRFLIAGGTTAAVDVGALTWLHGVLQVQLAISTALAYTCAFAVNFTLSRRWAFAAGRSGHAQRQLGRYLLLVAVNLGLTVGMVAALTALGLYYLAAKTVAIVVLAAGNFFAYRHWVFT
jgi:putative flippase GtrA